jgi:hypothetical protein
MSCLLEGTAEAAPAYSINELAGADGEMAGTRPMTTIRSTLTGVTGCPIRRIERPREPGPLRATDFSTMCRVARGGDPWRLLIVAGRQKQPRSEQTHDTA